MSTSEPEDAVPLAKAALDTAKPASKPRSLNFIAALLVALAALAIGAWQYFEPFKPEPAPTRLPQTTKLVNDAKLLMKMSKIPNAIPKLEAARELDPDYATIHFLLGLCYQNSNAAAKAQEAYIKCVNLPDEDGHLATCANNLGVLYMRQGKYNYSETYYKMALEKKEWLQPRLNLGKVYWSMDDWDRAVEQYIKGNDIQKSDEVALHIATILPKIYMSEEKLKWHHERYVAEVDKMWQRTDIKMDNPLRNFETVYTYYLSYHGQNDVESYKKIADITLRGHPSLLYVAPFVKEALESPQLPAATRPPGQKIKVGFSSLYFKSHASAKMIRGIIENIDHDQFEVVVFALREVNDPPMPAPARDVVAQAFKKAAHKYIDLPKTNLDNMRKVIEAEKLDVMVFAEIGMDPANYLLSFSRLAPVNVATHGHASTTGVPTIDYFVTYRPFEIKSAQNHYSEKLVTMPGFSYYHWPKKASRTYNRTEMGLLPDYPNVYACTQTLWKMTPDFDKVFRDILLKDPKGQLVIKQYSPRGADYLGAKMRKRMQASLADVYDRVVVLSALNEDKYLGLLDMADVILDSYPFGGYTTSLECFGMGVPVVTLPHPMFAGRCTYGFYKLMNITDLVASSRTEFVDLAVRLANDKEWAADLRAKIKERNHVLFESQSAMPAWNQFLEEVATGKPVTNLHVNADPKEFEGEISGDWPAA